jgi:uncharacterized protein (TIGR03118 family)
MKNVYKLSLALLACIAAYGQDTTTNSYTQTNLTSDVAGKAANTDPNLKNPWGLSDNSGSPWWVSDQVTGLTTWYDSTGTVVPLVVGILPASGTGTGSPTGTAVLNGNFVFVTLDGTIQQWLGGADTVIEVNNSSKGAVYTGCTVITSGGVSRLFVANAAGGVEAYDSTFAPVTLATGAFTDPTVPAGYAPYGIQTVGSKIYVTFTQAPGTGNGYVDAFSPAGKLMVRLQHGNWMNEPWGIAQAPASFGAFSEALLVGNTGSGTIAAFNPTNGHFLGFLKNSSGTPVMNGGLWALAFGLGGSSGPSTTLYFTAGLDNFKHGLFGSIVPTAP